MSTEFKPGQVWAKDDDHDYEVKVVWASRDSVHYERPTVGESRAQAKAFLYEYHLVKDVDATPAPLDPSKVKAGDTVTVRVEEFDIPDPYEVTGKAYVGPIGMAVGGFLLSGDRVNLTDHQPAAEPEPEWKPGTSGWAVVSDGDDVFSMRVMRVEWDGIFGFATESGRIIADEAAQWSVSDFVPDEPRPLPTREQIAVAIARADSHESQSNLYVKNADAVLALLRGESR